MNLSLYTCFRLYISFAITFGVIQFLAAQNLVKNPSFENYIDCPKKLGNLEEDLLDWNTPTLGSTDYFNGCSQAMGTPKNFNGEQPADFGVGYIGLYLYAPDDYREYVQAELKNTLEKGREYTLSFFVSLAERSDFAIKEFGICFSENQVQVSTRKVLSRMHLSKVPGDVSNYFEIRYSDFYSDNEAWVKVEKDFIANGTENYMIIGNFKDNDRTHKFKTTRKATKGSYYYLDMVTVRPSKNVGSKEEPLVDKVNEDTFKLNTVNTFKSVLFDFDTYRVSPNSIKELEQVITYLKTNPQLNISISGHTDDIGFGNYNLSLSRKRAKAVAAYLTKHGIDSDRISHNGYGSSKPLSTNATAQGRHQNRRVEFVFSERDH